MPVRATGGKILLTVIITLKWIQKEEKTNIGEMILVQNVIKVYSASHIRSQRKTMLSFICGFKEMFANKRLFSVFVGWMKEICFINAAAGYTEVRQRFN